MKKQTRKNKIDGIEETPDNLACRGGILFFVKYLDNIGISAILAEYFGDLRKSKKGMSVTELFKQIFYSAFSATEYPFISHILMHLPEMRGMPQ